MPGISYNMGNNNMGILYNLNMGKEKNCSRRLRYLFQNCANESLQYLVFCLILRYYNLLKIAKRWMRFIKTGNLHC